MAARPRVQIVYAGANDTTTKSETVTSRVNIGGSTTTNTSYVRSYVSNPATVERTAPTVSIERDARSYSAMFPNPPVAVAREENHKPHGATCSHTAAKRCEKLEKIMEDYQRTRKPWCDPDFPATVKSVYPSTPDRKIDWKRPKEIHDNPKFFSGGVSRFDVQQGELGDCWLLAAVASLSMNSDLFNNVVPPNQDFEDNYCGAFQFRFWKFGEWVDVLVDDRLPVDRKELLFMHSKESDEFWSALLEKAYAKLNGCYENLVGGVQAEAMEDFTGGLCETVNLGDWKAEKDKRFTQLHSYVKMSSLMGCSIDADDEEIEEALPNGLIIGHAYSVTDVREVKVKGQPTQLVRVRNPWGDSSEWNGAWSDGSKEWNAMSKEERERSEIVFDDDGEFWMSFTDFIENFTKLEVCHLGLDSLGDDLVQGKKKKTCWESTVHNGAWTKNVNAGGCRNFVATFWTNPQYVVDVTDPDLDDEENKGQLLIGLMQKDMRMKHLDFWTIGYSIYKLPPNHSGTLDQKFFRVNKMADKSPQYVNQREVVGRHKLEPGKYAIVPTTFQQNEEAEFMLRIFSEKESKASELDIPNAMVKVKPPVVAPTKKYEETLRLEKLREEFLRFSGPLGCINAVQLRDILNAALACDVKNFSGFNTEVCRSMLALMDADLTGKMSFDEFSILWQNLQTWKKVFKDYDEDESGAFDAFELRKALLATGFRVNNKIFACLVHRYADPDKGTVSFEDFILMVIRLKHAFETFKATCAASRSEDTASFNEEAFMCHSLYV